VAPIIERAFISTQVLLVGYSIGLLLATFLTFFAINTRIGTDFLETMTAMLNPLPTIALLPLALIWFGLGTGSLVFVLVHSVLWGGCPEHTCRLSQCFEYTPYGPTQLRDWAACGLS
jgi:ABC-type nitrate/sulfonate/bicarbonate transport system permease component